MAHPLHFWLGRLAVKMFPGHVPWAVSGISALGGAVTIGLVVGVLQKCVRSSLAAVVGGMALMLAHTFWRFSGLPEVYTLSAALLIAQLGVYLHLQQGKATSGGLWSLLFALNGLSFANHNMALLALPTWGIAWLLACRKHPGFWKTAPWAGSGWLLGSLPYTAWILAELVQSDEWIPVVQSALFGDSFQSKVTALQPEGPYALISLAFLGLSLPVAGVLALKSVGRCKQVPWPVYTLLGMHLVFFLRYNVIDQYTFFVPSMALIAILGGIGFDGISHRGLRPLILILILLQPLGYWLVPSVVRSTGALEPFARNKPFRDDAEYLFWPWMMAETSADELTRTYLAKVEDGGMLVIEDSMAWYAFLWMREHLGLEERVRLIRPGDAGESEAVRVPATASPDSRVDDR